MHSLKMLILIWLLHSINADGTDIAFPEITDILSNAQYLCPSTSFCDEPPLSQTPLPTGMVSCCRDCSCKRECVKRNDCCFPPESSESKANASRSECLYPLANQEVIRVLDRTLFRMLVDVTNCNKTVNVHRKGIKADTATNSNYINGSTCEQCMSEGTKCAECQCYLDGEPPRDDRMVTIGNCLCDKEDGCSCGNAKVAPWGSMLPVYSKSTGLIYKNSVCAACQGVNDGLVWIPIIMCLGRDFKHIESVIDNQAKGGDNCIIYFKEPEGVEKSLLPRCFEKTRACKNSNFPIPYGLNMSAEQIINACKSNFNSPYKKFSKNVFCAMCTNFYKGTTCQPEGDVKVTGGRISYLLTLDFVNGIAAKSVNKNHPIACTSTKPPDCRQILCSTGEIRDGNGACKHPMAATYVIGYGVTIRLIPIENRFLLDLETLVSEGKISFEHFISPWPRQWLNVLILLEKTRLMSSGRLKNITSFIIKMALPDPVKNQTLVFRNVRRLIEMKWILKVNDISVQLSSEFLEYNTIVFDRSKKIYAPGSLLSLEEILPTPDWILVYYMDENANPQIEEFRSFTLVTKLMFCEQIRFDPQFDGYTLLSRNRVLYSKSENKYIFEGNFAYDRNGQHKVHICLEDTNFVKQIASLPEIDMACTIAVIYIWIDNFLI